MIDKNRITAEHSLEANYLKLSCTSQEKLDDIALKVIKKDTPDFLMPIRMLKINGMVELRYTIGNQTALKYKDLVLNKTQFLQLYRSLLYPFIEGSDWMLDYHCFCIDSNYVFIDKNGRDALYMYIPVESCRNTDDEILNYFKDIVNRVTVEDDSAFLLRLYQSFSRGNVTLKELYQMVEQELQTADTAKQRSSVRKETAIERTAPQQVQRTTPIAKTIPEAQDFAGNDVQEVKTVQQQPQQKLESVNAGKSVLGIFGGKSETSEHEKKSGLFGLGKKNVKEEDMDVFNRAASIPSIDTSAQDEVINALFGTSDKKVRKKEKPTEKKKAKEKSGGLFGNKKKTTSAMMPSQPEPQKISENGAYVAPSMPVMQQPIQEIVPNYDYTQIDTDGEVTQIEGMYVENSSQYLCSMNDGMSGIPERIELNFSKERITIGRQSSDIRQPDIVFSSEYKRVGRMHACIQRENEQYYIVDLGSANATVLNGEILVPNQPYLLKNNDVVGFVAAHPIKYRVVL